MVWHLFLIDDDYGSRVGDGLGITADQVRHLQPLPGQTLTDADRERLANLGHAGRRQLTGQQITGSVHVMRASEVKNSEAATLLGISEVPAREAATAASR
jgi:catalase